MMKQTRKLLAALLVIAMIISMVPVKAYAADTEQNTEVSEDDSISGTFISAPYSASGAGIILAPKSAEEVEEAPFYTTTYQFYVNDEMVSEQIIADGETLYAPETPVVDGSRFLGWYHGEEEFNEFGTIAVGEMDQTIRIDAQFEEVRYVFFMANEGSETVCFTMETSDGETITDLSEANASVPVKANESVIGWKLNGKIVTSITIDGSNVTLTPEISSGYWLIFETSGGSAVQSVFYKKGTKTVKPADPTFPGYTFAGWYSNESRQNAFTFGREIKEDTKIYANWEAKTNVTYYVDYWLENANDDDYSFYMRKSYTGTTGALAEVKAIAEEGFTYNHSDVKAIEGDGSTIVNAYYKRNIYTVYFNYGNKKYENQKELICPLEEHTHSDSACGQTLTCSNWAHKYLGWINLWGYRPFAHDDRSCYTFSCGRTAHRHDNNSCYTYVYYEYKIDAKYGADISGKWPGGSWYVTPSGQNRKSQAYLEQMPLGGFIFYEQTSGSHTNEAYYYVEALGTENKPLITVNGKQYYLLHTDRSKGSGSEHVTDEERYTITGFVCNEAISAKNGATYDRSAFYYDRQIIDITFSNGEKTYVRSYKYGESIYGAGDTLKEEDRPENINDGFVFDTWYADKDFISIFDFTPESGVLTMSASPIIVYANWVAPTYEVKVRLSETETVDMKVEYGKTIMEAVGAEDPSLTWETLNAQIKENNAGQSIVWYTEAGNRVNTIDKVSDDMVLIPVPIKNGTTYTVKYYYETETGMDELKNTETYAFGAKAVVKAADGLGAEGKVFLYWIDQNGVKHYPQSAISIERNVELTAVWGDKPQKTMLIYHSNFEEDEVFAKENINVNSSVRILSYEDTKLTARENYVFLGWSTKQDAVTAQYHEDDNINVKYNSIGATHLYAVWQKESFDYTINYYLNGTTYAIAEATSGSAEANTAITVSDAALALEGYTLVVADQAKDLMVNSRNKSFAIYYYKNIELTAKSKTVGYTGSTQNVEGYDVEGSLDTYPVTFAEAVIVGAQGMNAGTYPANFNDDKVMIGLKDKDLHYIVTKVTNGLLTITEDVETQIVVTITGEQKEVSYNGSVQVAEGFTYTVEGAAKEQVLVSLSEGKEAKASDTMVGTYWMGLDEDSFVVTSSNYSNISVNVVDGWLKIKKSEAAVIVTINGNTKTADYSGEQQSVEGFDYTVNGASKEMVQVVLKDGATAAAVGMLANAEAYSMGLTKDSFAVTSDYYASIEVIVNDGWLKIDPIDTPILITAGSASRKYSGEPLTCDEYTYTQDVLLDGDELSVTMIGSQTQEGSSSNRVNTYTVMRGTVDVTSCYTFSESAQGTLRVTKRVITLVSATDSKPYDGNPLSNDLVVYKEGSDTFVEGEEPEYIVTGTQTESGSSSNYFACKFADEEMAKNYTIYTEYGTLSVSRIDEVVVTIQENSKSVTYNGSEQTLSGYTVLSISNPAYTVNDFSFIGSAEIKETVAGNYPMTLTTDDFVNNNTNFTKVTFVIMDGALVINPIETAIDIQAASETRKYNGQPLANDGFTYTEGILLDGDVLTVTVSGSRTDAGSEVNKVDSYKVMRGTLDVTSCYTFATPVNGTLTVSPREVTLTSATVQQTYNGTPLTNSVVTIGGDRFAENEGVEITMTGSQTDVGSSSNTFTFTYKEGTNAENYHILPEYGTLTVLKIKTPIVITAASEVKDYDGTPLENQTAEYTPNILVEGDELIIEVSGSQTVAGSSENLVVSYKVIRGEENVTSFYTFAEPVKGTLLVSPQKITLTSADATRSYNGQVLEKKVVTVTSGTFAENEGFVYEMTGSQLYVGSSKNTFTWEFQNGTDEANYSVDVVFGILTIEEYDGTITVSTISDSFTYNGNAQGTTVHVEGIPTGYSLGTAASVTTVTHVADGEVTANVTSLVIYNQENKDVTNDLKIVYSLGKIKITPAKIELVSGSAQALYSNAALTNNTVSVKTGTFAKNEGFTAETSGSQTLVGSSDNTFRYTLIEGTDSRDYSITTTYGTLTVLDTLSGAHPADSFIINKTVDNATYDLGDTITFTILVKNIYAEAKTVKVTEQAGVTIVGEAEKTVEAGKTAVFTANHVVNEEDIYQGTQYTNTATVELNGYSYASTAKAQVAAEDTTLKVTVTPDVKGAVDLGDEITYTITVKNVGNVTVSSITLAEGLNGNTFEVGTLAPEGEKNYTVVYKVGADDILAGSIVEIGEAQGIDPKGETTAIYKGTMETPVAEETPSIFVVMTTDHDGETVKLGDEITVTITITNNGNVDLKDVKAVDDLLHLDEQIDSLKIGKETVIQRTYTVTEGDLVNGAIRDQVTVSGTNVDPEGEAPETKTASVELITEKAESKIMVTMEVLEEKELYRVGDVIQYQIILSNTGNMTIKDLELVDMLTGTDGKVIFGDLPENITVKDGKIVMDSLSPEAKIVFTATYVVQKADVDSEIKNSVMVSGIGSNGVDVTARAETSGLKTESTFTLTIHYESIDGEPVAETMIHSFLEGDEVMIHSPKIDGFTVLEGQGFVYSASLPAQDIELTVQYKVIPVISEKPEEKEDSETDESKNEESEVEESKTEESEEVENIEDSTKEPTQNDHSDNTAENSADNSDGSLEEGFEVNDQDMDQGQNENVADTEIVDDRNDNDQQFIENSRTENSEMSLTADVTENEAAEETIQVQGIEIVQDVESGYNLQTISEEEALENTSEKSDICILHYIILLAALILLIAEVIDEKKRKKKIHALEAKLTAAGINPEEVLKK